MNRIKENQWDGRSCIGRAAGGREDIVGGKQQAADKKQLTENGQLQIMPQIVACLLSSAYGPLVIDETSLGRLPGRSLLDFGKSGRDCAN